MQKTAPSRPLFVLIVTLLASLCLLAGSVPVRAAALARTPFPQSIKPMTETAKAASVTAQAVDASANVEFQISLRMRDFAKLQARISRGERISRSEMQALYFPLASDYQGIVTWAKAQGLTVLDNDATHLGVRVSGPVAVAEQVLATRYAHVTVEGKDYLAAQTMPSLPTLVAGPVLGINGLQPYIKAKAQPMVASPAVKPLSTTAKDAIPYIPSDIEDAYNARNLTAVDGITRLDGSGQTIAILIDTEPNPDDLTTFWFNTFVPQNINNITEINVNNVTTLPDPSGEETLDVSWSSGIASGAKVRVYAVGSLAFTDLDKGFQRMISDTDQGVVLNELSISLGLAEAEVSRTEIATESQYLATLAARGVSIFVSTGDTGSDPVDYNRLDASFPATDPSVTAVGGTSLFINSTTSRFSQETVWNHDGGATGGGESIYFQMPVYQSGNGIVGDGEYNVGGMRLIPDVSSAADPSTGCYLILTKIYPPATKPAQQPIQVGGTSWSAPTWAGFCALINQARELAGLPDVGLLNPSIYPLLGTGNFRDIVQGNNYAFPDATVSGPFAAIAGYDEATGIGVPVVSSLVSTLTNTAGLAINSFSPQTGVAGTQVTLRGEGLDRAVSVRFNGTDAVDFSAVSGTELLVTVPNGATTGTISVNDRIQNVALSTEPFTVLPADAGANDNFTAAQVLGPATTKVTGSNVGATKEAGEPNHAGNPGGASIWYAWTAPNTGAYTINTLGSSFDTLLAVYTGRYVTALTPVASNDDTNGGVLSSVVFNATYNTTYYIAVDGVQQGNGQAAQGTVVLNVVVNGANPAIDDFGPRQGSVGQTVRLYGENFLSVTNVTFNGVAATFHTDTSTQITTVVPVGARTGQISVADTAGHTSRTDGFYTVVPVPMNDDFANATALTGAAPTAAGTNLGATKQPGEPNHADNTGGASVWFAWTAPASGVYSVNTFNSNFDTLLAVYTGDDVAALTPVASNDDAGPLGTSSTTFHAVGGTVYHIAIDGFDGATGNYRLSLFASSGVPTITALTPNTGGAGLSVTISGTGFLLASGVQFHGVNAPNFQANSDSQITVTVPAGATTGAVTVTGANGAATSPGVFTILPTPPNDDFVNATLLSGAAPLTATGYTDGATKQAGEPEIIAGDAGGHSIWYTWTPPAGGQYVITTRGSDFDTILGIFTGTTVSHLTPVASNDDDPEGGVTSAITLTATRGTTYHIVVDGVNGDAGNVVLSILNSTATINLYSTEFEAAEGFSIKLPLAGQNGWVSQGGVTGGNGLITGVIPNQGQQAFVGNLPLTNGAASVSVSHPISYPPQDGNYPVVNFSTLVRFANSTNGQHDRFGFSAQGDVYNPRRFQILEDKFFTLSFDEATGLVSYQLDDGTVTVAKYPPTNPTDPKSAKPVTFSNDVTYSLQFSLDYQNNLWNATLNGNPIVTDQPLTTTGYQLYDLTGIAADWFLADTAAPGDNYMAFDDYVVNTPQAQAPTILVQPTDQTVVSGSTVSFSVVAAGTPTLTYQWFFNGVPIAGEDAMQPTYTVRLVNSQNAGRYSVSVTNAYGTAQSLDAFLVISTTQAVNRDVVEVNAQVPQVTASSGQYASVSLTRTGDLSQSLTVSYSVHGTAQSGVDYVALSGTATIKAGRAKKRLKIVPIDRGVRDGSSEKVVIKVVGINGYSVGSSAKQKVYIIQD